jgi:D-3-phosphoglycerate dehydrogenase
MQWRVCFCRSLRISIILCCITPHNAGMTTESMLEMVTATAQQWIDVFHGKVPPRMVNPEAWPFYSERFAALLGFTPDLLP